MKRNFELRGASRRDFIKGVFTASAALGLGPTRALEILDQMGGSALAQSANAINRSVNVVAGTGAQAWFTLLWPVPRVIKSFNAAFAWDDPTLAKATKVNSAALEGRDLYVRNVNSQTLWSSYGDRKLVSALVCGTSSAHSSNATNTNVLPDGVGGSVGIYAGSAAIQSTLKALVPAIGIKANNDGQAMPFGTAPGAPAQASVANADAMVGLFSSAASRLQARLLNTTGMPSKNPDLFSLYHKAFLGLTRTADVITYSRALSDSRVAVDLLSKNLGAQLSPKAPPAVTTPQINTWCGGPMGTPQAPVTQNVNDFAKSLIVTSNAFKLGLCAQVNLPFANDDPHTAFANMATTIKTADQLVNILESFMADLATTNDPSNPNLKLSDTVVMTFSGDTPKFPFTASGWPDNTPGGSNWIYVMSQGRIKPGWFGDILPTPAGTGSKNNFDPASGLLIPTAPTTQTDKLAIDGAMAAILFAVSGGDDRRVRDFVTAVNYAGIINPVLIN